MNPLYLSMPTTIFEEMSALAREHGALNLGQGFPDGRGPEDVLRAAAGAVLHGSKQYPPAMGLPELRRAVIAAPALLGPIARAHQFITFSTPPNLQAAVAYGLGKEPAFFKGMRADLQRSRDRVTEALRAYGFAVVPSEGTYFLCVDLAAWGVPGGDADVCRRLVRGAGVAAIPLSTFYAGGQGTRDLIRLCFAKADSVLDEAVGRLARLAERGA